MAVGLRRRALTHGELRPLFAACVEDQSPAGPCDAAILAVLYRGGLRRREAAGLDMADYDVTRGALTEEVHGMAGTIVAKGERI